MRGDGKTDKINDITVLCYVTIKRFVKIGVTSTFDSFGFLDAVNDRLIKINGVSTFDSMKIFTRCLNSSNLDSNEKKRLIDRIKAHHIKSND